MDNPLNIYIYIFLTRNFCYIQKTTNIGTAGVCGPPFRSLYVYTQFQSAIFYMSHPKPALGGHTGGIYFGHLQFQACFQLQSIVVNVSYGM